MIVWPVYTYLALVLIGLGISLAKHGEDYRINFWSTLISTLVVQFLLYKGGFYDVLLNK